MVQRKAVDKSCTQVRLQKYINPEKRSSSTSENQDIRNKGGTDSAMIMKKPKSWTNSDLKNLETSTPMRNKTTVKTSGAMVTPQKVTLIRMQDSPPNYMKSTSSSSKRKEQLVVSPVTFKTSSDSKSFSKKESNHKTPSSAIKVARTLTKMPSFKPVRTLTKASSMKTRRPSMKKSSNVSLSEYQKVGKATCSSTQKDSMFPSYVMLQPGGTESEGFSVMKVCPYAYCSLNGYHHAPLPPLKQFLSAKRRVLKAQKSMRLKGVTPVKAKLSAGIKEETDAPKVVTYGNSVSVETELHDQTAFSEVEEVDIDFFVEICTNLRDDIKQKAVEDYSYVAQDDVERKKDDGRIADCCPKEPWQAAISFEELEQINDSSGGEMDSKTAFSSHIQQKFTEDTENLLFFIESKADSKSGWGSSESESVNYTESDCDESDYENTEMDWEEGKVDETILDKVFDLFSKLASFEKEKPSICPQGGYVNPESTRETVTKSVDINNIYEETTATGEELNVEYEDYTESSDTESVYGTIEMEGGHLLLKNGESSKYSSEISDNSNDRPIDLHSSTLDAVMESKITGEGKYETETFVAQWPLLLNDTYGPLMEVQDSSSPEDGLGVDQGMPNIEHQEECQQAESQCKSQPTETTNSETDDDVYEHELDIMHIVRIAYVDEAVKEDQDTGKIESKLSGEINETNESMQQEKKENENTISLSVPETITPVDKKEMSNKGRDNNQQVPANCNNFKRKDKKLTSDCDETREFNPREPNYLPVEPDPDAEKVDLRHQMMDDRRDAQEWMLDYAVRRAVANLDSARKKKVALLVEAFETVLPV